MKLQEALRQYIEHHNLADKSRNAEVVMKRQVSCYLIIKDYGLTQEVTGKLFNRKHCTMHHSIKRIEGYIDTDDPKCIRVMQEVKSELEYFLGMFDNLSQDVNFELFKNKEGTTPYEKLRSKIVKCRTQAELYLLRGELLKELRQEWKDL